MPDRYTVEYDALATGFRDDFRRDFAITSPYAVLDITGLDGPLPEPEPDPPRLLRVRVARAGRLMRWQQGWIANDFRAGVHRTRKDALRAWQRTRRRRGS